MELIFTWNIQRAAPRGSAPAASLSSGDVPVCSLALQSAVCQQEGAGRSNDSVYSKHGTQYLYTIFVPLCNDEERRRRTGGAKVWICVSPQGVRNEARFIRFSSASASHVTDFTLGFGLWLEKMLILQEGSFDLSGSDSIMMLCECLLPSDRSGRCQCEPAESHEGWETAWNVGQTVSKIYWKILVDPFRCCEFVQLSPSREFAALCTLFVCYIQWILKK